MRETLQQPVRSMVEAIRSFLNALYPPAVPEVVTVPVDYMTWLEFWSSVIASVLGAAWPVAFLIVAIYYKRDISRLIGRMKRLSLFGNESEFVDDKLNEAESTADLLTPSDEPVLKDPADADRLRSLAKISPSAAIDEKWKSIENWLRQAVSPSISGAQFRRILSRPKELIDFGVLNFEGVALLNDLRSIRNMARSAAPGSNAIREDHAFRFIELADDLMRSGRYSQNAKDQSNANV